MDHAAIEHPASLLETAFWLFGFTLYSLLVFPFVQAIVQKEALSHSVSWILILSRLPHFQRADYAQSI